MAELKHAERFTKPKTADNIRSHECPPLEQIRRPILGIPLNLLNSQPRLGLDNLLPMLSQIRLTEPPGEELAALRMLLRITHGKHAQPGEIGQLLVPDVLFELGRHGVDLAEALGIRDGDFGGRDADDGPVAGVQRVDVVDASAACDGVFEDLVREAAVPWSWDAF